MIPYDAFGVFAFQAAQHAVNVLKIDGYFTSSTPNLYLQVHDTNTTPLTGAVPKKEWPLNPTSEFYKEFKHGDLTCGLGCFVGVSSTSGTYTLSRNSMNVSVEVCFPDLPASVSFAGDLTSAVTSLQVWTEAAGLASRKSLVALEVDGTNLGAAAFIMLFAQDAQPSAGQAPCSGCVWPIAAGQVRTGESKLTFGEFGRQVFSIDGQPDNYNGDNAYPGDNAPGTKRLGCTIWISATPTTYSAPTGTCCIKAEFRTEP